MGKYVAIISAIIITSFFLFPFDFVFLPDINTKLILAVISLPILGINLAKKQKGEIDKDFIMLCVFALLVSFTTLFAVFYNNTKDYTYVSYVISMLVWTGGAYTAITVIKWIHGRISVQLVVSYLIAVCLMQCLLAIAINRIPAVDMFCSSFCAGLSQLRNFSDERLYGVGCAYDVAGMRFAAVLVMMGFCFPRLVNNYEKQTHIIVLYLLSFIIISVVGNMIARTTSVGLAIALLYVIYSLKPHSYRIDASTVLLWKWTTYLMLTAIVLVVFLYNYDITFKEDFRFAFEGFFSLIEKGKWDVRSNDALITMYRFPESLKTWIVGDGYFFDTSLDPYYTGIEYKAYYMATDVGYLRFIYYSGLIGLLAFIIFMCKTALICIDKHKEYRMLFFLILLLQFVVWGKVASDIYNIFAIFLVANVPPKSNNLTNEN